MIILALIGIIIVSIVNAYNCNILHTTQSLYQELPLAATNRIQLEQSPMYSVTWQVSSPSRLCSAATSPPSLSVPWSPPWQPPWLPPWPPPQSSPWVPSSSAAWLLPWSKVSPEPWLPPCPSSRSPLCTPVWLTPGSPSSTTAHISNKLRNRIMRSINSNRDSKGVRLAHWNAGSAHLKNKLHDIEQVVSDHHPHLLGISESNYKKIHDMCRFGIMNSYSVRPLTMTNWKLAE